MSNAIYKKDLHDVALAVAQGSKDYTDKVRDSLRWEFGTYDLSAETINGTTMLLPTPANTIQATMVRIDGNSEVSENLIVLDDVAETTTNGITYKVENGVITLNGTATQQTKFAFEFINAIPKNKDYYVLLFISGTTTATNPKAIGETTTDVRLLIPSTTTFNVDYDIKYLWFSAGNGTVWTNYVIKPMIVKGSTAPTEFKAGFEGIHNLELSGLKVEGANIHSGVSTYNDIMNNTIAKTIDLGNLEKGTYTISFNLTENSGNRTFVIYYSNNGVINTNNPIYTNIYGTGSDKTHTFTLDESITYDDIRLGINSGSNNYTIKLDSLMLNYGSVAKPYADYVQPTTLPIDLSTILYNGSPLFEGNSLKAVGTAKDYITPYVAHKGVGSRAYQSGDEEDTSVLTDGTTTLYPLTTPIEADIDFSQLVKFEAYSNGSTTLVNTNNQDTTSTFKYLKEVAK